MGEHQGLPGGSFLGVGRLCWCMHSALGSTHEEFFWFVPHTVICRLCRKWHIYQIGTFICEVPFAIICGSCDFPTAVQVRTVPASWGFAGILNEVQNVSDLSK